MGRKADTVEVALSELAEAMKAEGPDPADVHLSGSFPEDLADEEHRWLSLGAPEALAFEEAICAVEEDIRFEGLSLSQGKPYRDALWRFVCLCELRPGDDNVASFFGEQAGEPEERTCFFGVEALTVKAPLEVAGVRILPTDHEDVPGADPWFRLDPPIGAVVAVPITGLNLRRMRVRAEVPARHALRVLRLAIRENRFVTEMQLRFRLGDSYSFGPRLGGWETHSDARWELVLDEELETAVAGQALTRLTARPDTNIGRRAERALRWIDEASLSTDRVNGMLFGFFALEAMLGSRSQGLKGRDLAFKRALLSVAVKKHFSDPERAYRLYDEVRSDAVHGGEPELDEEEFRVFSSDVREALGEYLELAEREGIVNRKGVIRYLLRHPERGRLEEWLIERDADWQHYLDELRSGTASKRPS